MNNLAFLLVAIGVSIIGSVYLWLRNRKPQAFMSSIDTFQREMGALARDPHAAPRRRGKPTKLRPIVPSKGGPAGLADKLRSVQAGGEPRTKDELRPIVPAAGQQGLADKLRAAQRQREWTGDEGDDDGVGMGDAHGTDLKEH